MIRIVYIAAILFCWSAKASSQLLDTIPTLEITAYNIITKIDSNSLKNRKYINRLALESNVISQSNGPSLLTTPLIRGMSGRHTAIIWNGWNILSPINGVYDISLLTGVGVQYSVLTDPNMDILGNGSAAGSIILHDEHSSNVTIIGSTIENYQLYTSLHKSTGKWTLGSSFSQSVRQNSFQYKRLDKKLNRENNKHLQTDLKLKVNYTINDHSYINFNVWTQNVNREIAASTTATYRNDLQLDDNYRISTQYHRMLSTWSFDLRAAYFDEQTIFDNDLVDRSRARNQASKLQLIISQTKNLNWQHSTSYSWQQDKVTASFFDQRSLSRVIYGFNHNGGFYTNNLKTSYGVRLDYENLNNALLHSHHVKVTYQLAKNSLFAGFARGYQLPNFNDLYWPLLGNPNLKIETNRTYRIGIAHGDRLFKVKAEIFRINAENWIIWSPNNTGVWTPDNRRNIRSQGLDAGIDLEEISIGNHIELEAKVDYTYTHAEIRAEEQESLIGKRLIYIPSHKASLYLSGNYQDWGLHSSTRYTGDRFTDSGNATTIDAFLITDLKLSKKWLLQSKYILKAQFIINNIFNKDYEYIPFFPMPLRYAEIGCSIRFK